MGMRTPDAALKSTKALPAAAGSVYTDGFNLGNSAIGDFVAECEFIVTIPTLTTAQLPDTKTMTYIVEHDTDAAFGTTATLNVGSVVQTGAGGAGAAGSEFRISLPLGVKNYIRVKATGGAQIGDCSAASVVAALLF